MERLCSQNRRGKEREKEKRSGTVHCMLLTVPIVDMPHHFEHISFTVSKDSEAIGDFC